MEQRLAIDGNFTAYAKALVRHHALIEEGKGDGPEAEKAEETLSALWDRLTDSQRVQLRGLSSDLNWLRRKYAPPPRGRKREDVTPEELREFYRLNEAQDYLRMLPALRVCASAVPPVYVAFVRATCYSRLGLPPAAILFLRAVIDSGGKESTLSREAFDTLASISPSDAFDQSGRIIGDPEKYAPISVAQAITYAIGFLGGDPTSFARDELAETLRQAARRLDALETPPEDRVRFLTTAGAQLASFGKVDEGIGFLERALAIEPDNAELLGWLGEAVYPKDRDRAVALLQQSIEAGTRLVRPAVLLANHYLAAKDFERAKPYAARVVERGNDNFSVAVGLEVMAICLSEGGAPHALVLDLFRRAHALAPSVQRIKNNLASFEAFVKAKSTPASWETAEPETPFETRERWGAGQRQLTAS
ncbi:MAG: tetratricopeptide repeat protein [Gemmataceae bacterium]